MTLSDISIKNRVFAVMLSAAMIIFGYLGYRDLGISQFPEIDFPVVTITANREAASPETMEFDVADIIEDAVSEVQGIDYVTSQSLQESCVVTVHFHLGRDIDAAMQDVQNAVSAAASRLPTDIDPPSISKMNFQRHPIMWLNVHGSRPLQELSTFVDDHFKQHVESIPGVGGVMYSGLRTRNMRVWLDGQRLHAYQLDPLDVMQALRNQHVEQPAGYVQSDKREMNVRTMGEARTADEFRRLPIVHRDGQVIRLSDVAVVEDGLTDRRGFSRFDRVPTVGIGVMRATGANIVQVCDEVKRRIPHLRKLLPPGADIGISTDYSLFIKDDMAEVNQALFLGILLTAAVTFLFLGSLGTTLNVCLAIPTSLIGTFVAMRWFGFTINFMTLLALSLAVGVVVDDAILVLENIYRRREHGDDKHTAALRGAREISFAAIAATLSIVAIFVPVAFMKGAVGRFFFQFGITVTVAVLLSLVVSLTLTPMLCSVFLRVKTQSLATLRRSVDPHNRRASGGQTLLRSVANGWFLTSGFFLWLLSSGQRLMNHLARGYAWLLRHALRHQWWVVPASLLLAASALLFAFGLDVPLPRPVAALCGQSSLSFKPIGRELVPSEDQNRFYAMVICPVGTSVDYMDEMMRHGEEILAGLRDPVTGKKVIAGFYAGVSYRPGSLLTEGSIFVRLVPKDERTMTQIDIMNAVRGAYAAIPGVRIIVMDLSTQGFTASRGYPVNFAVQGPDWHTVTDLAERVRARLMQSAVLADVNTDYRPGMPEVHVVPDREKAAELGIPIERLALAINVAFGGTRSGRFTDTDRRYDVRLRYLEQQRDTPNRLDNLYVKGESGRLVPLKDVTRTETISTLPVINRYNHLRKVELTANVAPGASQGEAIAHAQEIADEVREEMGLPPTYRFVQLGNAQAMQQTMASLWWALALGFVVATMILGVQFNSFVHPFTVLMAVPFGVTGALATLWITGDTLNMMSMIGMILLAGLVKKNSIILVDYTNQLRAQGMELREAVLTACPIRLRPILMTSMATIAAALPLAFGVGPGAETRAPMARSIIGGIILSTLVTLIIVPIFYVLFDRFGGWVYGLTRRKDATQRREPDGKTQEPILQVDGIATEANGAFASDPRERGSVRA